MFKISKIIKFTSRHYRHPTEHHLGSHGDPKTPRNQLRKLDSSPLGNCSCRSFPTTSAARQESSQRPPEAREPTSAAPALPPRAGRGQCACAATRRTAARSSAPGSPETALLPDHATPGSGVLRGLAGGRSALRRAHSSTAPAADFPFLCPKTLFRSWRLAFRYARPSSARSHTGFRAPCPLTCFRSWFPVPAHTQALC